MRKSFKEKTAGLLGKKRCTDGVSHKTLKKAHEYYGEKMGH